MSKTEKLNEEQVFKQEVSDDELEAVAGGHNSGGESYETVKTNCITAAKRDIYKGGFPNCAASVEDGSWCWDNDACTTYQGVYYTGRKDCGKAWE